MVGRGSREQVVVFEAVMMSAICEEVAGEKAVSGWWIGGGVVSGSGGAEEMVGGGAGAAREVLILESLSLKKWRKELQRSMEADECFMGGWRRFLTVEKRVRGQWLEDLIRVE